MLGNCEKIMTAISSTTNQWPQNQILDDHRTFMASSSANKVMEKTNQDPHHQQQLPPLKCPRCDSSNTKFCYYNNYSLSQPRHFCKACKRYWTRGGTLRNVPVGGGCRKNKRPKRQSSSGGDGVSSAASTATANPSAQPQIDLSPAASNRIHNPLFYSLPTNPLELNFPFSSFSTARVSSENTGFDLHPQMNGLGIGFSSGLVATEVMNNDYKNGFKSIQDVICNSSSSLFSAAGNNNNSLFFGSSNFASSSTMASLLASTLQHQKLDTMKDIQAPNSISGLMPYEDPQMPGGNGAMGKEAKPEAVENGSVWNPNPNPIEQINSSDPSSLLWNNTNLGAWFDPSNMGSSVPSLI